MWKVKVLQGWGVGAGTTVVSGILECWVCEMRWDCQSEHALRSLPIATLSGKYH